jgi:hypothetical protein
MVAKQKDRDARVERFVTCEKQEIARLTFSAWGRGKNSASIRTVHHDETNEMCELV